MRIASLPRKVVHYGKAPIERFSFDAQRPGQGYTRPGAESLFGKSHYFFDSSQAPQPMPYAPEKTHATVACAFLLDLTSPVPPEHAKRLIDATKREFPGAFGRRRVLYGGVTTNPKEPVSGEALYWSVRGHSGMSINGDRFRQVLLAAGFKGVVFNSNEFGNITETSRYNKFVSLAVFDEGLISDVQPELKVAPEVDSSVPWVWDFETQSGQALVEEHICRNQPIPREAFAPRNLQKRNAAGKTILHYLAFRGKLGLVPEEVLTHENLQLVDKGLWPVMHEAILMDIKQLPASAWTQQNLEIRNSLTGMTSFHYLAANRELTRPPASLLTDANFRLRTNDGATVYHMAAVHGAFHQVPEALRTRDNLLLEDKRKMTVMHYALSKGELGCIPEHLLTQELLTVQDDQGRTPVFQAALNDTVGALPPAALSEDVLLVQNSKGNTALDMLAQFKALDPVDPDIVRKHWEHLQSWMPADYAEKMKLRLMLEAVQVSPASMQDLD